MFLSHSSKGDPFYILDFLINVVVLLPGGYNLKCSLMYDLVQLFQSTVSSPELGLLPEYVQSLIHHLYRVMNIPINVTHPDDGVILKATILGQNNLDTDVVK